MPRISSRQALIGGAIALGAAAALRAAANARERRRKLASGELRPVQGLCTQVGEWRMHTHAAFPVRPSDAPPVVLIHGFGVSSSYYLPTVERLGRYLNVYAPDLPGHGKSDQPRTPLDVPELTAALIAWMDATGIECASLVGNSMGCQIAVEAALRYPSRVERMVLIGPTTDPKGRSISQLMTRFLIGGLFERLSLNWLLVRDYAHMGTRLAAEFNFMRADEIEVKLPHVDAPTMLVRGWNDSIVPQSWLDEVARLIGAKRVAVIPHMGHAINHSAADELASVLLPFLAASAASAYAAIAPTRTEIDALVGPPLSSSVRHGAATVKHHNPC